MILEAAEYNRKVMKATLLVVIAWMIDVLGAYEGGKSIAILTLVVIDLSMGFGSGPPGISVDWVALTQNTTAKLRCIDNPGLERQGSAVHVRKIPDQLMLNVDLRFPALSGF